jgi:hypothetical protein
MTSLNWRLLAASSLLALAASPALAQRADSRAADAQADEQIARAAEMLADEDTQDRVSRAVQAMSRALLAMPVGQMAEAVREIDPDSPMADMPRDTRVADLMGDEAQDMPREMGAQSRVMMRMMSGLSRQFATMAPVLRDMARDMGAQMEREMRNARRGN